MTMAKKYTFTFLPTGSFNYTLAKTSSDICLNPRIHMGCDTDVQHMNVIFEAMFQSTHPHRMRQGQGIACHALASFNPRTHIGCDQQLLEHSHDLDVSIHAPT